MPDDRGAYGAWLVVVAIIGAVGGSVAILMYPYFVADKGWRGPKYRKLQVYDLLFGVLTLVFLNIAIWVVAAELMRGNGDSINEAQDLARMMELAIGPAGPTCCGSRCSSPSSTTSARRSTPSRAWPWRRSTRPSRSVRSATAPSSTEAIPTPRLRPRRPPSMARTPRNSSTSGSPPSCTTRRSAGSRPSLLLPPLLFALPNGPGLVAITVVGNAIQVFVVPAMIVGLIWMTANRRWMLKGYVNKWWENLILLIIGGIGFWAAWGIAKDLPGQIADLF
jgi:hypothetical protein